MMRRRVPVGSVLLVVCVAVGGGGDSGSGDGHRTVVTGFSAPPQPSTAAWGRQQSRTRATSATGTATMQCGLAAASTRRHRRRHRCGSFAAGGLGCGDGEAQAKTSSAAEVSAAVVPGVLRRMSPSRRSTAAAAVAPLGARPPTTEEMDAEWEGILSGDDEQEDVDEGDEDDDATAMLSDEELLATDASVGGLLGDEGEEEQDEQEEEGVGRGRGRKPRVWYDSYKARMKAEKAKEAAWQEKRKTFSKAHNDYLDEAQRNREIAAARREKYTKKFYRDKKIYDIVKERGRKAVREATWATRWPRQVTRKLEDLQEGEWITGKVRNVESYGAWVDVNAERDGLLHVKDMGETFTPSAGEVVATKDIIQVRVKFVDPVTGKLGLSLVEDGPREGDLPLPPPRPPISVADVSRGAELWGYVERVTNMGAYVNVGAEVPGFLLLKEIPGRPKGLSAPQVLRRNKRLRVYAREVDREGLRIKLTCKRPRSLPRCGPAAAALASDADAEEFDYDDTARVRYSEDDGWDRDNEYDDEMEVEDGMNEFGDDNDEFDDDEGEEWFYPERGQVIPAPAVDLAPRH
ncbi:unnamed protein product [Ectocarpus sp. CCAP 1310/34]|nr:unnamed protein product [Ectocarpus sp. CCAP 1310/34]